MVAEWREVTIGEIASSVRNALVGGPFGSNLVSRDYVEQGIPVIRGQNMGERWVNGEFVYVTPLKAESLAANLARPGDIVFTQRGTLGQVSLVPAEPYDRYLVSQSQMKLTVDREVADPLFFYYVFSSDEQKEYIRQNSIQTGVPHTNLGILRNTPLLLPPLHEQSTIAHILGTLDDKIELNRKMNQTLEAMARAIFKSWFVDFDPVRAKAEGHDLGLPPELAALFPDSFDNSKLGAIPKGWEVKKIEEVAGRVAMGPFGSSIRVDTFVTEGIPVISGQHLRGFMLHDHDYNYVTNDHAEELKNANVYRGDIIFTHAGSIGQVAYIPENSQYERYVISQRQFYMRCNLAMVTPSFITCYFRTEEGQHKLLANTSSTGVPSISRPVTYLRSIELCIPPKKIIDAFEKVVQPMHVQIRSNIGQSNNLAALRDTLLPKLLSGALRVRN